MSKSNYQGANLSFTTDTFEGLVERVNLITYDIGYNVLTSANVDTANSTNGSQTDNNAHLNGIFAANTLVAFDSLRGGQNDEFSNSSALHISSNVNIGNSTTTDTLTVFGDANFNANVVLGNATTDKVTFTGSLGSSVLPLTDVTYDLGSPSLRFSALYSNNVNANAFVRIVNDGVPILFMRSTSNTTTDSATIQLRKDNPIPTDGETVGKILGQGLNSNNGFLSYTNMTFLASVVTEGEESGSFNFAMYKDGVNRSFLSINSNDTGEIKLYHANSSATTTRLTTKNYGVLVNGELEATTLDINGISDFSGAANFQTTGTFGSDVTIGGDLIVSGNVSLPSNVSLIVNEQTANTLTVYDNFISSGNTQLGDTAGDTIQFIGRPNTNILPSAHVTYNLGSGARSWNIISTANVNSLNINSNNLIAYSATTTATLNATTSILTPTMNVTSALNVSANVNIENGNSLKIYEPSANGSSYVALKTVSNLGASYTLTLPPNDGTASQYLQTDGSGILSWATVDTTLSIFGSDGSNTDISLNSEEITFAGANGVTTNVDANGNVTISIPQTIATSSTPSFNGVSLTGVSSFTANASFNDFSRLFFGTGGDTWIFHNGTSTFLDLLNGDFIVRDANTASATRTTISQSGGISTNGNMFANTFSGNTLISLADTQSASLSLLLSNTTISLSPNIKLRHDGNTDINTELGEILYQGENSTSGLVTYSSVVSRISSAVAGAEHGTHAINAMVAGTTWALASFNQGGLGEVRLHYANSSSSGVKFHTSANGVVVTGNTDTSGHFVGNGNFITTMNASNMSTGTLPSARLTGAYTITSSNVNLTLNNTESATLYPTFVDGTSGTQELESSTKFTFNPSSGQLNATTFVGALPSSNLTGTIASARLSGTYNITANVSTNFTVTNNTTENANLFPVFVDGNSSGQGAEVSSTKLAFNPSTGFLYSTTFVGALPSSNLTGTIASARLPDLTVSDFAASAIQISSESFSNNNTSLMTSAAIKKEFLVDSPANANNDLFFSAHVATPYLTTTASYASSRPIAVPFLIRDKLSTNVKAIQISIGVQGGLVNGMIGIYERTGMTTLGARLAQTAGNLSYFSASDVNEFALTSSVDLPPNWYWIVFASAASITLDGVGADEVLDPVIGYSTQWTAAVGTILSTVSASPAGWSSSSIPADGSATSFAKYTSDAKTPLIALVVE